MVIALSFVAAILTVIAFLTFPEFLIGLFMNPDEPNREAVIAIGIGLLAAAALSATGR